MEGAILVRMPKPAGKCISFLPLGPAPYMACHLQKLALVIVYKGALIKCSTWMVWPEAFLLKHFQRAGLTVSYREWEGKGTDGAAAVPRKGPWNSTLTISPPPLPNFNTIFSLDCINESNK